jgi:hypothetical protein
MLSFVIFCYHMLFQASQQPKTRQHKQPATKISTAVANKQAPAIYTSTSKLEAEAPPHLPASHK